MTTAKDLAAFRKSIAAIKHGKRMSKQNDRANVEALISISTRMLEALEGTVGRDPPEAQPVALEVPVPVAIPTKEWPAWLTEFESVLYSRGLYSMDLVIGPGGAGHVKLRGSDGRRVLGTEVSWPGGSGSRMPWGIKLALDAIGQQIEHGKNQQQLVLADAQPRPVTVARAGSVPGVAPMGGDR